MLHLIVLALTGLSIGLNLAGCTTKPFTAQEKPRLAETETMDPWPKARAKKPKIRPKPPAPPAALQRQVSVHFHDGVPIKMALLDLAQQAGINVALAKGVEGGVTLKCQNCRLSDVLDHVCRLARLRATFHNGTLQIEPDTPYLVNYDAHFLSLVRQSEHHFSVNTEVFSARNGSRGGDFEGGNKNIITGQTKIDFWQELEVNLQAILQQSQSPHPQPTSASSITLHRQAGMLSVFATQQQHALVRSFLDKLQKMSTAQVLIEAKLVEVALNRDYESGIDWAAHGFSMNKVPASADSSEANSLVGIALKGKNFSSTLKFLETFGKTRTLSSPRLTVLNNQPAIFKVAENRVYFRLRYERLERSKEMGGDLISTSSDIHTMPLGLILSVQPSINLDDETITLALRPTITSSTTFAEDPAVSIASKGDTKSPVPIVEVRELDSILHLKSGQAIVLGGLMQERSRERTSGLPGTNQLPVLKTLLGADSQAHEVVELVIFLRAHILDPDDADLDEDTDATMPDATELSVSPTTPPENPVAGAS